MGRVESLRTENKLKKTEIGEIPVDWEVVNLGEVTQLIMGQSPPSESYFEFMNGVPFFQGNAEFGTKFPKILKWCNSPRKLAEKGDILVSVRAPVGDINIAPVECCIGRGLAALRGTKIYNDYLYFVMNYFKDTLVKIGQGSTFEAINKKDLFKLKIPFPIISEQKKIAEILVSVDEAIDKKQEIIERTKMLKKGLMQELLTRGIGHKKFKNTEIGEIPVDWKVKKIKDTGKIITGNTPPTKNLEYYNNDYLWATPGDLGTSKYIEFTARMLSRKGIEVSRLIPRDSILVVCIGSTIGKVGMALHDMATNQQINSIICNKSWNPHFVYYWMLENSDYLVSMAGKHVVPIINKTLFSLFSIPNPSKDEQSTIGLILNSLDEEIEKEMAHKERLESIKKGLMQVLLTGKIRAKI